MNPGSTTLSDQIHGLLMIRVVQATNLNLMQPGELPYCVIHIDDSDELVIPSREIQQEPGLTRIIWKHRTHFDVTKQVDNVTLSVYQKNSRPSLPTNHPTPSISLERSETGWKWSNNTSPTKTTKPELDKLLGSVKLKPGFVDQELEDRWYNLQILTKAVPEVVKPRNSSIGKPIPPPLPPGSQITGQIHVQMCWKLDKPTLTVRKITIDDFVLLKTLGKGSYGTVVLAVKRDTNRPYAIKCIKKSHLLRHANGKEIEHTLAERHILTVVLPNLSIPNPFMVPMKWCFQSDSNLYFVLSFINGGELFRHLQQQGRFDEARARFYLAELLTVLETLHGCGIIYRDLKPENILLDANGHISLCDFGLCKILTPSSQLKTSSFCGTPSYMAPEILQNQEYTNSVDFWTLGVLLYEMLYGLPPFWHEREDVMYGRILLEDVEFDSEVLVSDVAKDFMRRLLEKNPKRRLGHVQGGVELRNHEFFDGIDWELLLAKGYQPPFVPNVVDSLDTSQFDPEFTTLPPVVGSSEGLDKPPKTLFKGFSYSLE